MRKRLRAVFEGGEISMKEIQAPNSFDIETGKRYLFLAGSIEMGVAENWQQKTLRLLADTDWVVFNPRRNDWDSSWVQSADNPKFREQVCWELDALGVADKIILYFDPSTKSPISLLEFGLFATSDKLIVICPEGFWRKGNVDIVCQRHGIKTAKTLEEAISKL